MHQILPCAVPLIGFRQPCLAHLLRSRLPSVKSRSIKLVIIYFVYLVTFAITANKRISPSLPALAFFSIIPSSVTLSNNNTRSQSTKQYFTQELNTHSNMARFITLLMCIFGFAATLALAAPAMSPANSLMVRTPPVEENSGRANSWKRADHKDTDMNFRNSGQSWKRENNQQLAKRMIAGSEPNLFEQHLMMEKSKKARAMHH